MYAHMHLHLLTYFNSAEDQLSFAVLLDDTSRPTIQATLDQLEWNEQQINSFENKMYQSGQQLAYCHSDTEFVSFIIIISLLKFIVFAMYE